MAHDRDCGRERLARRACGALLIATFAACNPKSGLESAAGAIDPTEKSYIDGPGSRLAVGPFDSVGIDLDLDTGLHLLARRRDDAGQSMTFFGEGSSAGCTVSPNVLTWFASKPDTEPYRLLPYFESRDESGVGTLRFTSIDCRVEPYSVPLASELSDLAFEAGFLMKSGSALVLANPWTASTKILVNDSRQLFPAGPPFLVWGDAQVIAFDRSMNELMRYGNNVSAVAELRYGSSLAVMDDDGLHTLTLNGDGSDLSFDLVDADACAMGAQGAYLGWVVVHSPCSDDHLVAEHLVDPTSPIDRCVLSASGDSTHAEVWPVSPSAGPLPQLATLFLQGADPTTSLGTLFAATESGEPVELGESAPLNGVLLSSAVAPWAGIALVGVQAGLGRLVRWSWDGTLETLAENVLNNGGYNTFLTNFDGHSGDLESLNGADLTLLQSGAPPFDSSQRSLDYAWALRLDHYDGVTGDLMLAQDLVPPPDYEVTAARVPAYEYEFLSQIPLPGFAYIGDYDEQARAGTLFVQNQALGSTQAVANDVSDFTATAYPLPGILYAVPSGGDAGIWFARAK